MEIITSEKGKNYGRISVLHTLATMQVGETWYTNTNEVSPTGLRAAASRYGSIDNKRFTITAPASEAGQIRVTRNQ